MSLKLYLPAIVLAFAMVFFIFDIISDVLSNEDGFLHLSLELMVFMAISLVLFHELQHVKSLNKVIIIEKSKTARLAGELLQVMKEQFAKWQLTPSECEVSLLLIKGLSMKEIAEARQVKEKTVRGQATAIYAKANCAGRHELAAYFIEDLMREV
ncbi:helix-turn-helix transcriptional regulator [Colwellia psychrerythraea]|uniref:Transcriptional regulator, LuxR family n=1 Tax=Colwellia psychrerythraea (strain 34H / ATCC BAA-681) TaxID=167879 RepID=Q47YK2_COLP3|nr:LuxR C-terminal-related transcriptional regulator [Colwellia psychrerythraea]AAZ24664.1 transcriptional regulator, LuxR family [Colwellia psychrerythraea 34H]